MSKDDLLRGIVAEKVDHGPNEPLSKLINNNKSRDVDEIVKKLNLQTIEDDVVRRRNRAESWNLNDRDYASIVDALNSNSTATKRKILDKLLNSQIVDTRQSFWGEVSQSLRKCFVSASNDIFLRTLKIHYRIIVFPNTSCDGYLNLLKGTFLLLNSRYFNDLNKNRVFQTIKLVIETQNVVIKYLLHSNLSVIDDIVTAFISVITFKSVFDWFGALDPETVWLRNFCYGSYIRNTFFNNLKEKNSDFVKCIVSEFVKKVSSEDKTGMFYGHFLLHFWQYKTNLNFLSSELSAESTLELILSKFSQQKSLEFKHFVITLFLNSPLLVTPKLLDVLVEPISIINRATLRNTIEIHSYIFTIVTNLAESPNFKVLFGICNLRKGKNRQITRNCTNLPQKITDVTMILLRTCLTENEIKPNTEVLALLLNCCAKIFESHPSSITHVNPTKLLEILPDFYRLRWKNDPTIRTALLSLFKIFFTSFGPTVKILDCDNDILLDLLTFTSTEDFKTIVSLIGHDKIGFEFLKSHRSQIVKPYLEKIWSSEDVNDDVDFTTFVFFLFVLETNTRSVVALLSDDDDDSTVVESGEKSVSLADLVEKSLDGSGDVEEEYLGLTAMKVFIMNLDLLLYLQANHQMQEKLAELGDEESRIVDAQSSLRNNILVSLEIVGFVGDEARGKTEETELQELPQIFEFLQFEGGDDEFRTFLESGVNGEVSWLSQAKRAFKNSLGHFDPSLLPILLDQLPKTYVYRKIELNWPPADCVYYQLHPEDFSGISLVISFGSKTGLLKVDDDSHNENLALLIKQSRAFLGHQPEIFSNFDWFVGIVFLICSGDFDRCKSLLVNVTNTHVTSLIWATFGKEFDDSLQENFYQHFAVVLEENCPCFQAMKMLGLTPRLLAQSWLNQCFFNHLRFEEICNFLAFSVLYPVECLLYYMVAIFQHLNRRICTLTHSLQPATIFEMTDLSDFRLCDYISFVETLMKRYRNAHKL